MSNQTIDHLWVSGPPFCSSTILVAPLGSVEPGATTRTACEIFDIDGEALDSFEVEFPAHEVGVIELEPFVTGLKMQGGLSQGHVIVTSSRDVRHFCRQQIGGHFDIVSAPKLIASRESSFVPLILGGSRDHLVSLLNAADEIAQVTVRLFYGSRSPEWTLSVPARGCSTVALEEQLLADFDDTSWRKGAVQGYIRVSPKSGAKVAMQIIEKMPMEGANSEQFRCLLSW
jgi:hypothetical protein